jgi:hypothetical protein
MLGNIPGKTVISIFNFYINKHSQKTIKNYPYAYTSLNAIIQNKDLSCLKQILLLLPSALSFLALIPDNLLAVKLIRLQFIFVGKGFYQFG